MSRERELLERAIDEWDSDRDLYEFHKVIEEIRVYLAEPEQDEEPVAYRHLHEDGWEYYDAPTGDDCNGCHALFLHPAPRPEFVRLSEEEIGALANSGLSPDWTDEFELYHFARAIEDALEEKNK